MWQSPVSVAPCVSCMLRPPEAPPACALSPQIRAVRSPPSFYRKRFALAPQSQKSVSCIETSSPDIGCSVSGAVLRPPSFPPSAPE
eukprot:8169491-Pyramimonas_sp.AAC.1